MGIIWEEIGMNEIKDSVAIIDVPIVGKIQLKVIYRPQTNTYDGKMISHSTTDYEFWDYSERFEDSKAAKNKLVTIFKERLSQAKEVLNSYTV